jgi:hypothetical protein
MRSTWLLAGLLLVAACGGSSPHAARTQKPEGTTTTKPAVQLPYTPLAFATACPTDAETIKLAEQAYSLLNNSFATMPQLVAAKLLREPSTYYPVVKIGSPPGGYTLIGGPKCNNIPVAG